MDTQNKIVEFKIENQSSLVRLDKLLCSYFPDYTRSKLVMLIENGSVLVNSKSVSKNYKVKDQDTVQINFPPLIEYDAAPEDIDLDIVYEDADLVVVNKKKNMVVHPAHGNLSGTLVNALLFHCKGSLSGINGVMRPGIVHRIDKDTSGLLVVAKNDTAHTFLANQFKNHSIIREYHTIVSGVLHEDVGTVNKPIGRHPTNRKKMACTEKNSKHAVTHYEVISRYNDFTYLKCKLETGRTHQIRVHMSSIGHSVIGDEVYGTKTSKINLDFKGQCLHAKTLGFVHPTKKELMIFDSDLPEYFSTILKKIEKV